MRIGLVGAFAVACAHGAQPAEHAPQHVERGGQLGVATSDRAACLDGAKAAEGRELARDASACDSGDALACQAASVMLACGIHVPPDRAAAIRYAERGCDLGNAEACNNAGDALVKDGDVARGEPLLDKGCSAGSQWACTNLGVLLQQRGEGRGALALYVRACDDHGHLPACSNAGALLALGAPDVAVDDVKALRYGTRACDGGNDVSCGTVGTLILLGRGGRPRDAVRAAALLDRACRAGGAAACSNLGNLYGSGDGVLRDLARASALHEKACEEGYRPACAKRSR
jgi:TPR repeat protein